MGKTAILGIDELAQGQSQAFTTVNDAISALERAANASKTLTETGSHTLSSLDFIVYREFRYTSLAADATVTLPSTINGNTTDRELVFVNETAYVLTVAGTPNISIPPDSAKIIHVNGAVRRIVSESGVVTGVPHTTAFFAAGHPTHEAEVLRYVFAERVVWPVNFSGSVGSVRIAPSPGARFFVYKNGSKIGEAVVSTGGAFSFTASSAVSWAIGDVLTIKFEALETATIIFSLPADNGDTVTLNDGVTGVTFTFGGGGGQVAPGVTAADSATNLEAAINGSALSSTIAVSRVSGTLTIVNLLPAGGATLSKSDADNDYAVSAFTTDSSSQDYAATFYGTRN